MVFLPSRMIRILLFVSTLAAVSATSADLPSSADRPAERNIITISALGTDRVTASKADVRLAIEERGATDGEARERMARRSNTVLDFLRGENVERLETLALRLHPIYDYTRGDREVTAFQAMTVIRFRSDARSVGFIVDEAIARGANQVQELRFTAPEAEIEQARQRALQQATRIALERGEAILRELGLTRKEIVRIHASPGDEQSPSFPMPRMEMRAADRSPTDLEAGEPEIHATVTLEISY
jgi:uncharacterized protein